MDLIVPILTASFVMASFTVLKNIRKDTNNILYELIAAVSLALVVWFFFVSVIQIR